MGFLHKCRGSQSDCRPTSRAGRILHFAGHVILGLGAVIAVAFVFGWVTMTAWNAVIPAVFNLPLLTFWQAVGLLVLGRILTARFHHHRGHRDKWRKDGAKKCSFFSCSPHPDQNPPPDGDSFAQWWWEEGQALFKTFQTRKAGPDTDKAQNP